MIFLKSFRRSQIYYSLNLDLENIFLKREKSKGFYIEIDKINISQNNLILSTKSIIWDFRVLNLLSLSIDKNNMISSKELKISNSDFQIFIDKLKTELGEFENINILSNEINIRSLSNDIQIQSKNNRLDFNTNSLLNLFTSKFIFSSTLSFNNESFEFETQYNPNAHQINIVKFIGNNIYMNRTVLLNLIAILI